MPLQSAYQLNTPPATFLAQMLSLSTYLSQSYPRRSNTEPAHTLPLTTPPFLNQSLETSTLPSQLPFWELFHTTLQSPVSARNPSLSMNQYQLKNHTMSLSQPQYKVNQSSKRLPAQPALSTHMKYNMPQLSTLEPLSEVMLMELSLEVPSPLEPGELPQQASLPSTKPLVQLKTILCWL